MIALVIALQLAAQEPAQIQLPYQWLEYCALSRDGSCKVDKISKTDLAYINMLISETIKPDPAPQPGRPWVAFPANKLGQCDTMVMTKRAALLALGMNPADLQIELGEAVYPDGKTVAHMILWARVDGKWYALDNLTPDRIYQRGSRPYTWRSTAQQPFAGVLWETN